MDISKTKRGWCYFYRYGMYIANTRIFLGDVLYYRCDTSHVITQEQLSQGKLWLTTSYDELPLLKSNFESKIGSVEVVPKTYNENIHTPLVYSTSPPPIKEIVKMIIKHKEEVKQKRTTKVLCELITMTSEEEPNISEEVTNILSEYNYWIVTPENSTKDMLAEKLVSPIYEIREYAKRLLDKTNEK